MNTVTRTRADGPTAEQFQKSMYYTRQKIHPKTVWGKYRKLKWLAVIVLLAIYYVAPWIRWDRGPGVPDQAILADIVGRRLYFFSIEIWPQEVYYLTGILFLSAVGLFLASALYGRLWCGYACPQTVWTDLFIRVEELVEGERSQRIRLEKARWSLSKLGKKAVKHAIWVMISLLTGGAWIFYFNDAPTLVAQMVHLETTTPVLGFIGLFAGTTYVFAGWGREQLCVYMCPWPRFQSALQDEESLIVTYESWRGEPRGPVRKSQSWEERKAAGGGDCIDCQQCVHVCPAGIDIRDGLQMECIGCGLCIDACNDIMKKIGRPGELVTFDTVNAQVARAEGKEPEYHRVRPRTIVYTLIMLVVAGLMVAGLVMRPKLDITVIRDRAPMFVTLSDGEIRNAYTFHISNMTRRLRDYTLTFAGIDGATMAVIGQAGEGLTQVRLTAEPDSVATYRVTVTARPGALKAASTPVTFILSANDANETVRYESVFIGPQK